jgi:glucose-6-phosphate isomerase
MISLKSALPYQLPAKSAELLKNIPKRDYTDWLNLAEDEDGIVPLIKKFAQERQGQWDRVLCLGMGGSALGIVTLQKAFFPFDERLKVLDNLDSNTIHHELEILNPARTLVLVISKSGGTLETMTQYAILKEKYSAEEYRKNFVIITDPNSGTLRDIAKKDELLSFPVPPMVGGRFSVLTAVGLLPYALLGGNLDELLNGAADMKKRCLEASEKNPALQLAQLSFELKKPILVLFTYDDQLSSLGPWYQQLLAESIGKTDKVGLTPLPLRGASDQHSVLQLLQDGPNDKLNIFLEVINPHLDVLVPMEAGESRRTVHNILRAECHATEQALREDGRPTIILEISELSPHHVGELFMLFQMQIAILGELYGVDAFNQPGVEKSKKIVKEMLKT